MSYTKSGVYLSVEEHDRIVAEERFADRLREDMTAYMRENGVLCKFGTVYTHDDGRVIMLEDNFAHIPQSLLSSPFCNIRGYRLVYRPGTLAWVPLA